MQDALSQMVERKRYDWVLAEKQRVCRERDRYREALQIIGVECEYFAGGRANCVNSGRTRGAPYTADAWCDRCIAREALNGDTTPSLGVTRNKVL